MNYNDLSNDLKKYMLRNDSDFRDQISSLIEKGVNRIYNRLDDVGFICNHTVTINANATAIINLPSNFRTMISVSVLPTNPAVDDAKGTVLQPRSKDYCNAIKPSSTYSSNYKYYYIDTPAPNSTAFDYYGGFVYLFPEIASSSKIIQIRYWGLPVFNSTTNQTNFLTQRYPNILLYSCLIEACLYLDNEEKRNKYSSLFENELENINRMNAARKSDNSIIRGV